MATQTETVVTPERLAQGISYKEWAETIDRNQDKFEDNYKGTTPNPADVAAINAAAAKIGGVTCLALGEAWCPGVVRGMPVIGKLAEATGLDLKIFFRDQNLDIMNEFLYKGEFQSIPTLVFYTRDHKYIGHWIEKAKKVREDSPTHLSPITSRIRNQDLTQEERDQAAADYVEFKKGPIWASWRDAQVREIRELLEANCK